MDSAYNTKNINLIKRGVKSDILRVKLDKADIIRQNAIVTSGLQQCRCNKMRSFFITNEIGGVKYAYYILCFTFRTTYLVL